MVAPVARYRVHWTVEEQKRAVELALLGYSTREIGRAVDRTRDAVKFQLTRLGVKFPRRGVKWRNEWTPDQDATLVRLVGEDWTLRAIGEHLDRSQQSVSMRLKRLGVAVPKGRPVERGQLPEKRSENMTDAELDALIAERRPTMSPDPHEAIDAGPVPWEVPVIRCGRRWNRRPM